MRRDTVRLLFVAALLLLPIHYALIGILQVTGAVEREPWPAVVFPGFKNVWDSEGSIAVPETRVVVRFADGGSEQVPASALLAPLPTSHHSAYFRAQCGPAPPPDEAMQRCRRPEVARWFAHRLDEQYPERRPRMISIIWGRLTVDGAGREAVYLPEDTVKIVLPRIGVEEAPPYQSADMSNQTERSGR